jgi:ATP-grasp domain, R2K clade family 3
MSTPVLYCCDPLDPRRVDMHFAAEAGAVRALGGTVALVDHDALVRGEADDAVRRVPRDLGPAWYRGWMLPSERYRELLAALVGRGADLLVPSGRYQAAHELPGWYPTFAEVTPCSVWQPSPPGMVPSPDELATLVAPLGTGPAVVKDYVKSRKHEWEQACFIPDLSDRARLHQVVERFVRRQEDLLTGGIVIRGFEPYIAAGGRATEARVWWLDGEPILVGPHPDTPGEWPHPHLDHVRPLVRSLGCRWVTTDVALRRDGVWRVIEVGDGQVSDWPQTADVGMLAAALSKAPHGEGGAAVDHPVS